MTKAFDLTKLRKSVLSKIEGISTGFHDPKVWINTNNYALNYFISGRFDRGIPLGQITIFGGQPGSGKSFLAANVMRNALEQGVLVIVFDSENGMTKEWLVNAGLDVDKYEGEGLFLRNQVAMIDDLARAISDIMKSIKLEFKDSDNRPKILFVIDSLTALLTATDVAQFEAGDMKGDMGRQAKALKALVKNCMIQFAEWDIGLIGTNHTYASQNMFDPDDVISGGLGPIYAASIVVAMQKSKLKEDDAGNKISDVTGIRSRIKVVKSRYAKPFEAVEIKIPYHLGIDAYSGLVELFEKQNILVKDGNRLAYVSINGEEFKEFRKYFTTEEGKRLLDRIMAEHKEKAALIPAVGEDLLPEMESKSNGN